MFTTPDQHPVHESQTAPQQGTPGQPSSGGRDITPLVMMIVGGLLTGMILAFPGLDYCPNDASRWNTIYFLAKHGTYAILPDEEPPWLQPRNVDPATVPPEERAELFRIGDRYWPRAVYFPLFPTIDMVKSKYSDTYYSSKPPLLPTMLAGLVWLLERIPGVDFRETPRLIMRTTLILVQVVPLLILIWLLSRHVHRLSDSPWVRNFCILAAGLATYLTPWSITLNNHVIAACLAMLALHPAILIWYDGRREWYLFAMAGFFATFTMTNELPAAVLAAAIFGSLAVKDFRRTLLFAAVPAMVPVAALLITNYAATGSIRPAYSEFGKPNTAAAPAGESRFSWLSPAVTYDYEGSYWRNPQGMDALAEGKSVYLTHILVGHHGWFLLTPIFLLSLLGMARDLVLAARPPKSPLLGFPVVMDLGEVRPPDGLAPGQRPGATRARSGATLGSEPRPLLAAMVLSVTAVIVTFYTYKTNNYGGTAQGPRWMFWLIPLWLLFLPQGVALAARSRPWRMLCCVLLAVSMISAAYALRQPWGASWAHELFRHLGWIGY